MIELSVIRDLVAIFGVIAGFSYYVLTVRNSQRMQKLQLESRQFAVYLETVGSRINKEFHTAWMDVMWHQEYSDFEDWWNNYGPLENPSTYLNFAVVCETMQHLGLLVKRGGLDPMIVYEHAGRLIMSMWSRVEPLVRGWRGVRGAQGVWSQFEYLNDEMVAIWSQENPQTDS